jgi:S1-C subfamily serine protease
MNSHDGWPHSPTDDRRMPGTPVPQTADTRTSPVVSRRRRLIWLTAGLAAAAVVGIAGTLGVAQGSVISGTAVAADVNIPAAAPAVPGQSGGSGGAGGVSPWGNSQLIPGSGQSGTQGGGQLAEGSASAALGRATATQQVGVVDIDTVLSYAGAEAAGTGLVLTANGEILTNNHVVEGSTSITVTIVSTGASYPATVVGTDAVDDIAVLQLTDATGLSVANLAKTSAVGVGDAVTGVGNAGGAGGTPSASPGYVTAINQTISTQAEGSAAAETLSGLIETSADIQAGDSGGPLFDASDQVIGIDTAAQSGGVRTAGYAIPIASALTIAGQIEAGQGSQNIVIGYPAFLGVEISDSGSSLGASGYGRYQQSAGSGALISGVVSGAPADQAGLAAGDTIIAIDGTPITDGAALSAALAGDRAGQTVTVTFAGGSATSQTTQATLVNGPAA